METLTAAAFTTEQRRKLAQTGVAMHDGSFPIRNRSDLRNALRALGRAGDVGRARDHIVRRARDLNLTGMLPDGWHVTASAAPDEWLLPETTTTSNADADWVVAAMVETLPQNIGLAPLVPPADWFYDQQLPGPTPLTVTADGQVYGHLAEFGKCHRGIAGRCVMAPRSPSGYAHFNVGRILTSDGSQVDVGKLTVNAHHASLSVNAAATAAHYDHTGTVAAFVRAGEDQWGPWLAGATRSDATPEQIRDLRANPPSGDWRNPDGRGLDLVAALAVPVPGFPVVAVTAGLEGAAEEMTALILTYGCDEPLAVVASAADSTPSPAVGAAEAAIRTRVLAARISGGVEGLAGLFR